MGAPEFVHLHLHTDYSLLDGACPIHVDDPDRPDLGKVAKRHGMRAMAITDHGFMGGVFDFYQRMGARGVKPILGCEFYVSPVDIRDKERSRDPKTPNIKGYHIVLLAESYEGYLNLCRLNAIANLEGLYYKPRVDKRLLRAHAKGVLALSACTQGEPQQAILANDAKRAKRAIEEYVDIFGRGNYYAELIDHGMEEQKAVNDGMLSLAREYALPVVATNDCHYLLKEHAKAHDALVCIGTSSQMSDPDRLRFSSDQLYVKSPEEMFALFKDIPEALSNTLAVAERCSVRIPTVPDVSHYPVYRLPDGSDDPRNLQCPARRAYLRAICAAGLRKRYGFTLDAPSGDFHQEVLRRMDYELGVIDKMGFTSYFLVVWDFINHAKTIGVPVGPGRGSGAGSLVAYLSGITDIDPLRYGLLFERFLNPDRVSPPDFDVDFCERRRPEVIEYVRNKYGAENVAQIGTYGTLKPKAVVKDIGRALGRTFDEVNELTKLIPADPKITLAKAMAESAELRERVESGEPWIKELFELARPLEGLNRHSGIHAAGVIIGDQPLQTLIPLCRGAGDEVKTQYTAPQCEALGLLKMDFLGLRTLTIIDDAVRMVRENTGVPLDISAIPLDDRATFRLLNRGDTICVFQLESKGMRDLCSRFGVDRLEDIIALIALYRPGPMEFIPRFIDCKTGKTAVEYDHPKMEAILKETQGIMLYQEQIMQVVQQLAGFSLGHADILRRAISKKKGLDKLRADFIKGCAAHSGMDEERAAAVWEKIDRFANYGFNKSHSAAYAFLSYRTAYLKANHPVEFMAAVLTSELGNSEKLAFFIKEVGEMDIKILPPDVNASGMAFTADKARIRFGLGAVKGVGEAAANAIIQARAAGGPFKDIMDFSVRVGAALNSRVLEALARVGAFDSFGFKRSQLVEMMPSLVAKAKAAIKEREAAKRQPDFFGMMAGSSVPPAALELGFIPPDIPEFPERLILADEKELLGFYVSGHPLAAHAADIRRYATHAISELPFLKGDTTVRVGGLVEAVSIKRTKRDKAMAVFTLEDPGGSVECVVFPDVYERFQPLIEAGKFLFVTGLVSVESSDDGDATGDDEHASAQDQAAQKIRFTANEVVAMEMAPAVFAVEMHVHLNEASAKLEDLERLKSLCAANPGQATLVLCVTCEGGEVVYIEACGRLRVTPTHALEREIKALFGEESVRVRASDLPPPAQPRWRTNRAGGAPPPRR